MFCCGIQANLCVSVCAERSPPSLPLTSQHCLDHWPPWVARSATLSAVSGAAPLPPGVLSEGFVFFFHFMLWWPRLCWPESSGARVCTLGPARGRCRISGRISGTELDSRTWGFPPGGEAEKKGSHPLRSKCLFKLLLVVVLQMTPQYSAAHLFVARTNGLFGPQLQF